MRINVYIYVIFCSEYQYHIINIPLSDYPEFSLPPLDVQIKQEPEDENKYNPEDANGDDYNY